MSIKHSIKQVTKNVAKTQFIFDFKNMCVNN